MACLQIVPSRVVATSLVSLMALGPCACGPTVEVETGSGSGSTTSGSDDGSSTTVSIATDTIEESSTTDDELIPDFGLPAGSLCPTGAGDLEPLWTVSVPGAERADAVAVGVDRVAWTAGSWADSAVRVLDLDGNPLWEQPVPLLGGEGALSYEDLAIDPAGGVVLAGTILGDTGWFAGLFRWYDATGGVLAEDVLANETHTLWQGVAMLPDGDAAVAGQTGEELLVRRHAPGGAPVWTQTFAQAGAQVWGSHVAVAPDGTIFVSGHINAIPGPVLLAYDPAGTLLWSRPDPDGSTLDEGLSVAADGQGRALLAINTFDSDDGRIERYDAAGTLELTVPLDFPAIAIATDIDGSMIVAGTILGADTVVVERRSVTGSFAARYEQQGYWSTGVAVDEDCHAYVVSFGSGTDPTLVKLR